MVHGCQIQVSIGALKTPTYYAGAFSYFSCTNFTKPTKTITIATKPKKNISIPIILPLTYKIKDYWFWFMGSTIVNGDSSVNIFDLVVVADNFGKSDIAPPPTTITRIELTAQQKYHVASASDLAYAWDW